MGSSRAVRALRTQRAAEEDGTPVARAAVERGQRHAELRARSFVRDHDGRGEPCDRSRVEIERSERTVRRHRDHLEHRLLRLEVALDAPVLELDGGDREARAGALDLDHPRAGLATERLGLLEVHGHRLQQGMGGEQHRRDLLGGHLDQPVLAEAKQVRDLLEHERIVHGVRDPSRAPGAREVEAERDVEAHALRPLALRRANADDALELEALDAQAVVWGPKWASLGQWVTSGRGSTSVTSKGQRLAWRLQLSVPASRTSTHSA